MELFNFIQLILKINVGKSLLVRVKCVCRHWPLLAGQPFLWPKGVLLGILNFASNKNNRVYYKNFGTPIQHIYAVSGQTCILLNSGVGGHIEPIIITISRSIALIIYQLLINAISISGMSSSKL